MSGKRDTSKAALRERLTPEQFQITQEQGTEPAFSGAYHALKDAGTYLCVCCGQALFDSTAKYDSGSGWPSFWAPTAAGALRTRIDESHGMRREEVLCGDCGAHLGHVFPDGPEPTGLRYCINSGALEFRPQE